MRNHSQLRDVTAAFSSPRSERARDRTSRRRKASLLPRAECLEDRSCPSGYSITLLPPLPGDSNFAIGDVNNPHDSVPLQVTGWSESTTYHAVVWQVDASGVTVIPLGNPGGEPSYANGLNDAGQVVGQASTPSGSFLWQSGAGMTDLAVNGAVDINNHFQVIGGTGGLWQNGVVTGIGTLPGFSSSIANSINEAGKVVGATEDQTDAFLWSPTTPNGTSGSMIDLGHLRGGNYAMAWRINNNNQVVGFANTLLPGIRGLITHAFLWQNGVMSDLGTFDGRKKTYSSSMATGINDSGQVVGSSGGPFAGEHAFIWQSSTGMVDLNTLIPSGSGWLLNEARAINNAGQIVGIGSKGGFLMTPTTSQANSFQAALPATMSAAIASRATPLGTTTDTSNDTSSFPRGPLGLMPDTSLWGVTGSFSTHRRHTGAVSDLWVIQGGA
jgi:probable HAF family extracellular repeat protein